MLGKDYQGQDCAMARALEMIGERWTLLIIRDAFFGVRRFNDFQAHLDVPKAVLSDRLSGLVQHGILDRRPDPGHGGRHLYELTDAGRDLWPVVSSLLSWGSRHSGQNSRVFRHAICGSLLDDRSHCPTCDVTPGAEDILMEPRRSGPGRRDDAVSVALRSPHRLLEPVET
jgi:DNA-binding HxlR family transcriptional regulator